MRKILCKLDDMFFVITYLGLFIIQFIPPIIAHVFPYNIACIYISCAIAVAAAVYQQIKFPCFAIRVFSNISIIAALGLLIQM